METIVWDKAKLNRFSNQVERFLREGHNRSEVFRFDGQDFAIGYAMYLIEYLQQRIK